MAKFKKSQILFLSLLAVLLSITPLLSSSVRTTYLYFVINILIIALGAEAGLLSCFPKPAEDNKKHPASAAPKPEASADEKPVAPATAEKKAKVVERSASEKVVGAVKMDEVKKCPSTPSLFFIGGGETDQAENVGDQEYYDDDDDDDQEEEEASDEKELFAKSETFIGNFYKQLKMQREESWNRIHGLYQKAF
jgi:hypothetical protein